MIAVGGLVGAGSSYLLNAYQRVAGEAIFEIGRRLKHVKENDLAHGEFGKWLGEMGMSSSQANRFMRVYEEFSKNKLPHVGQIGLRALYEITLIPEEHREKAFNDDGSLKTVREIEELKRQLKQAEQQAEIER